MWQCKTMPKKLNSLQMQFSANVWGFAVFQAVRIHASILSFIHPYIHLPVLASTLASSTLAWAMVLSAACSLLGCHI